MRIDIKEPFDTILLQNAQKMGMSPTQYICYLLDNVIVEVPKQERIIISKPVPRVIKRKPPGDWNVKDY